MYKMKKICTLCFAAMLASAFLLTACGGSKVDEDLVGNYIPVAGEAMGVTLVGDELDEFGDFSFELNQMNIWSL